MKIYEIIEEQVDIGDLVFDKGGDDEEILYGDGNEILIVRRKLTCSFQKMTQKKIGWEVIFFIPFAWLQNKLARLLLIVAVVRMWCYEMGEFTIFYSSISTKNENLKIKKKNQSHILLISISDGWIYHWICGTYMWVPQIQW